MSSVAATKARIAGIENELEEIETMKAKEEKLRRTLAALQKEVAAAEADEDAEEDEEQEEEEEEEAAPCVPVVAAAPEPEIKEELSPEQQRQKKIKALNKKLQQIAALKEKGGELDADAQAKIGKEPLLRKQIEALKAGKEPPAHEDELPPKPKPIEMVEPEGVKLPENAEERQKRVKVLKKKLSQIAALKAKGGSLDKEEQDKVASERLVVREIEALESGAKQVVLGPPTEHEKHEIYLEQKHELERKIKAISKKLGAIGDHKVKNDVHHTEQAKMENEASLKKDKHELERQLGQLNREDQLRMAHRLGDDQLKGHLADGGKNKKKKGR